MYSTKLGGGREGWRCPHRLPLNQALRAPEGAVLTTLDRCLSAAPSRSRLHAELPSDCHLPIYRKYRLVVGHRLIRGPILRHDEELRKSARECLFRGMPWT